jgi:hypothetical protein
MISLVLNTPDKIPELVVFLLESAIEGFRDAIRARCLSITLKNVCERNMLLNIKRKIQTFKLVQK